MKVEKWAPLALFLFALLFSFYGFSVGFSHTLYDEHGFRQSQTAITAYFLAKGGSFFAYETPLLGPPWTIPFELPVYQWLTAILHKSSPLTLIEAGRVVGRAFFLLAIFPLYSIFRSLELRPTTRWIGLTLYLLSPLYLFWSRTILIESAALFFALAYFANFLIAKHSKNSLNLLCLVFFGTLAGTVKVTTAFTFFLLAGLLFVYWFWAPRRIQDHWKKIVSIGICGFVIPGILSLLWIRYTDAMKGLSPLAEFLRSKELQAWNFGSWQQRVGGDLWYMFFRKTLHDSIGHRTTFLLSLPFLFFVPRKSLIFCVVALASFLVAPMIFTNLHIEHNYYWYANGIFLLAYLIFLLDGILQSTLPRKKVLFSALLSVAVLLSLREYSKFFLEVQKRNETGIEQAFVSLKAALPEEDVVLAIGADWYPAMAWEMKRRTIMARTSPGIRSQAMLTSLKMVKAENRKIGAILVCGRQDSKDHQEDMEQIRKWFVLEQKPISENVCQQFLVRAENF